MEPGKRCNVLAPMHTALRSHNTTDRNAVLEELFAAHYEAVLRYARRRTNQVADAEEVIAQTFVVAWRRLEDMPAPDERLPWLYGIARHVLLNQRRGAMRRARLHERMRAAPTGLNPRPSALPRVIGAIAQLSDADREILRLMAWEDLSHAEIATVLGISPNAVAIRIHRARARLNRHLAATDAGLKGLGRIRTLLGWKGSASSPAKREKGP